MLEVRGWGTVRNSVSADSFGAELGTQKGPSWLCLSQTRLTEAIFTLMPQDKLKRSLTNCAHDSALTALRV